MGKCLVTRLKAVVDNDNLPVFGAIEVSIDGDASENVIGSTFIFKGCPIDGVTISGKTISEITPGTKKILIRDKYRCSRIEASSKYHTSDKKSFTLNVSSLAYCTQLDSLSIRYFKGAVGNLDDLASSSGITHIDFGATNLSNCTGDSFSKAILGMPNLNYFCDNSTNIKQTEFYPFIQMCRANGRIPDSYENGILFNYCGGTIDGESFLDTSNISYLKWDENTITYKNSAGVENVWNK